MNKKNLWIGLLLCSLFVWSSSALAAGPATQRQIRQQQRIDQGRRNGTLSHGELKQLNRQQQRIADYKHKAMRDHRITRHEARRMHKMQDRASHQIYRYKHNRVQRPKVARHHQNHYRYNHPVVKPRKHCRVSRYPVNAFSGVLAQPGLSLAWNLALDK